MAQTLTPIFTHNHHRLHVQGNNLVTDVLAFDAEEHLSKPYRYRIEFTSAEQDIAAERLLNQEATFGLYPSPHTLPKVERWQPEPPPAKALRERHGVITGFKRLSHSLDEARYEVILEPRFALLARGKQFRLYQNQSVPQIVGSILRGRHDFDGWMFEFVLHHEYPRREQVMQHDESDLEFISRLLAEVGIWYRFNNHVDVAADILYLHDHQRFYEYDHSLPYRKPCGFASGEDGVWNLQTQHQVVEQRVSIRNYIADDSLARLDGEVDLTDAASSTYGEAYHYAEAYRVRGNPYAWDDELECESGEFFARLRHERYLNQQARLSGNSSCSRLAVGQMLKITDGVPKAFDTGAVIVGLTFSAARDRALAVAFDAIPYLNSVCFRPPALRKPRMAGTLPARVTTTQDDPYGYLDNHGRYRVNFLFDCDDWQKGRESAWLRLARPYAGETHGLHLPLTPGTEVAVAFEQGDPDRPYIAHALHDDKHPDPVSWINRQRNVLRTPANNKLRMDDTRGQEHVKLSSEHGGKSQLNLGHLVDARKQKRGEGFELRSDGWGGIRAGKGLFLSADKQEKVSGAQLEMEAAIFHLESALAQVRSLASAATQAAAAPADLESHERLAQALNGLVEPGILLHAPAGIGLVSPEAVCLASSKGTVGIVAAQNTDITAGADFTAAAKGKVSFFAQRDGLQVKAAHGGVDLHAQDGAIHALARSDIKIESIEGRVEISSPLELIFKCAGAYIRLKDGEIELGAPGNIYLKAAHVQKVGSVTVDTPITDIPGGYAGRYVIADEQQQPRPFTRYQITTATGEIYKGVTDSQGQTLNVHTQVPGRLAVEFPTLTKPFDQQLRLVGPEGEKVANLKYLVMLADGSTQEGTTDAEGYTHRFVTPVPMQLTQLTLFPPQGAAPACCAAKDSQVPMVIDLAAERFETDSSVLGRGYQELRLPKGKKRAMTAGEMSMAGIVFKDAIDYTKVKIHRGGWWLFLGAQNTAVSPNGEMYFPESTQYYKDDFSSTAVGQDKALFMHELTHVWQYQLGYPVKRRGVSVSSRGANAYRYELSDEVGFSDYNMEQQGEIVSDYYMICVEGDPGGVWNPENRGKSSLGLSNVLEGLLRDPRRTVHLPRS